MTSSTLAARGEPLSDQQLAVLRSMLEEQRAFRVDQLAQLHRPGPNSPLSSSDPEIFNSLAEGARAALQDVHAALWRIDDGSYGLCVTCGDTVGVERLEILPAARLCMPCQRDVNAVGQTR